MTVTSQSMQYDAEPSTTLPDVACGLSPNDCRVTPASTSRHADCLCAALLAAVGGLDAAHNIVTPLSWGSFTSYAGKPVKCSPVEAADASFCHAIIHRQEGHADGEFGTGFSNANYWYRMASGAHLRISRRLVSSEWVSCEQPPLTAYSFSCQLAPSPPPGTPGAAGDVLRAPLLEAARRLAAASGDARLVQHVEGHGVDWSSTRFVGLCAQAAQGGTDAAPLRSFCEGVMAEELRLFVEHCLRKQREAAAASGGGGGGGGRG